MAAEVFETLEAVSDLEIALEEMESIRHSKVAAMRLASAYSTFLKNVGRFPMMYPLCEELGLRARGYRKALIEKHVVVYEVVGSEVHVIRLFHQCMDYAKLI